MLCYDKHNNNINNNRINSNNCKKDDDNNIDENNNDKLIPKGSGRGTPRGTRYENTLYYGRHINNINNNKNNSNNCNKCTNNNNYQLISYQRNKSGHYDQSLGRCRPDHPDQSLKRDHNQNNSREYIQYSNPHYYYEVNRKQNHRKHCGHICDCSCKEVLDKHENKQIYPQGNNYSSSHRCGNRCKSDLSDQYLDKCKSGPHDQYLNGNYGHRNHCDNNCGCGCGKDQHDYHKNKDCSYIHSWDHRCKPGHPDQYLDKCKSGQYGQYLNGNYVQRREKKTTPP